MNLQSGKTITTSRYGPSTMPAGRLKAGPIGVSTRRLYPSKFDRPESLSHSSVRGKQLARYLEKWKPLLGLSHYEIVWELLENIDDDDTLESYTGGRSHISPERQRADLEFSARLWTDPHKDDKCVERTVVHELLHVVIHEHFRLIFQDAIDRLEVRPEESAVLCRRMDIAEERIVRTLAEVLCEV